MERNMLFERSREPLRSQRSVFLAQANDWHCVVVFSAMIFIGSITTAEELQITITDSDGRIMPARVHIRDAAGEIVKTMDHPFWHDHFVCHGQAKLFVSPGIYSWEIERGPEYKRANGTIQVNAGQATYLEHQLPRIASLRQEGWFSGDLHVHRSVNDIKLLMQAEDLDFAPVIDWWNAPAPDAQFATQTEFRFDNNRVYCIGAGEDEREGGALLYFGLKKPLDLTVRSREFPSPIHFVRQAKDQNAEVWIDIEKPFWWDVPTWLASQQMKSIGLANNHMNRSGMFESEAWGRPRDTQRLPAPQGNGHWTQEIYYHILNTGIRLPPSAGSASGVLRNPVGYNRVYVHLGDQTLSRHRWFSALEQGRCFVTNGPLLRVKANGSWPGRSLQIEQKPLTVKLDIEVTSNDRISRIEIIQNGRITKSIPCSNALDQKFDTQIEVREPGWILVRAMTNVAETFRFASTAPWYIESPNTTHRISKRSAEFFLDWVNERITKVNSNLTDQEELTSVLEWHLNARRFWLEKRATANAD